MNSFLIGAIVPIVAMQTIIHEGIVDKIKDKWNSSGLLGKSLMAGSGLAAVAGLGILGNSLYNHYNVSDQINTSSNTSINDDDNDDNDDDDGIDNNDNKSSNTPTIPSEKKITPENNRNSQLIVKANSQRSTPVSQPMTSQEAIKAELLRRRVMNLNGTKVGEKVYYGNSNNFIAKDPDTGKTIMIVSP